MPEFIENLSEDDLLIEKELEPGAKVVRTLVDAADQVGELPEDSPLHDEIDADALSRLFQDSTQFKGRIVAEIWDVVAVIAPTQIRLYQVNGD